MDQQHELMKEANLARLMESDIPGQFIQEHPQGWDERAWEGLLATVESAGYWPINPREVRSRLQGLLSKKTPPPHRTRSAIRPSIEAMQTPSVQADAAWRDADELAGQYIFQKGAFWLGRCPESDYGLGVRDDRHVFMTCGSRGGKGTGIIIPNHLLWPGPLVSLDPKGENATVSAARRGAGNDVCIGMNQKVCVLDPMHISHVEDRYRARFNPLDELRPDDPACIRKAAAIADSLVLRTGRENEDYWKDDTVAMLHGLILHIVSAPEFKGRRHLGTLRDLVLHGDQESARLAPPSADPNAPQRDPMDLLFVLMKNNPAFHGEVSGTGKALFDMKRKGERQWVGIHSAMRTHTDWLRDPAMRKCVEASDFSLSELKARPEGMSIYLCLPERDMAIYNRWQRVLLNLMAYELQGSRALPACGQRILMCLDEFGALDKLKEFERGIAYFAGYGVKLLVVLQTLSRLKAIYEQNWQEFLGNSSVKLFFDLSDPETPEAIEKWLGDIELVRYAETHNFSSSSQQSSTSTASRNRQESGGFGVGTARSEGTSDTFTEGESDSTNESFGGGTSHQEGSGTSQASAFLRYRWIGRNLQSWFPRLRKDENWNLAKNTHSSDSESKQWQRAIGRQTSRSRSRGRNEQETVNFNLNRSKAVGEASSLAAMVGRAVSYGGSITEQFHKRPLIWRNDIAKWFSRIDDPNDPLYPGLALVMIQGQDPGIIRRVNYFDDAGFDGYWDRDPNYPQTQPLPLLRPMSFAVYGSTDQLTGLIAEWEGNTFFPQVYCWYKRPGDAIAKGDPLLAIKPGPSCTPFSDAVIPVHAPVSGRLLEITAPPGTAFQFGLPLGTIEYHLATQRAELWMDIPNEVDAYNNGDHPGFAAYRAALAEHDRELQAREAERLRLERAAADERERKRRAEAARAAEAQRKAEHCKRLFEHQLCNVPYLMGAAVMMAGLTASVALWAVTSTSDTDSAQGIIGVCASAGLLFAIVAVPCTSTIRRRVLEKAFRSRERWKNAAPEERQQAEADREQDITNLASGASLMIKLALFIWLFLTMVIVLLIAEPNESLEVSGFRGLGLYASGIALLGMAVYTFVFMRRIDYFERLGFWVDLTGKPRDFWDDTRSRSTLDDWSDTLLHRPSAAPKDD